MKNVFLIVFFLQLCLCKTEAQFFNVSTVNIERVRVRNLIVVMQEADPKFLKKIEKHPDKQKRYNTIIAEANQTLKKCILKYWTINDIDFMSYSQCRNSNKETDTSFFTIYFASLQKDMELLVAKDYSREELLKIVNPGRIEVELMEHFFNTNPFNKEPIYVWNTPTAYPYEGDLIIAIQQIRNYFNHKYEEPRFNTKMYYQLTRQLTFNLAYKTLLLDAAETKKYGGSYEYIHEDYPYKYKVTNFAEIVDAIKTRDTNYAYVAIIPYHDEVGRGGSYMGTFGGGMSGYSQEYYYMHLVIDAATSTILSIGSASEFANLNYFESYIDKTSLKNYARHVE